MMIRTKVARRLLLALIIAIWGDSAAASPAQPNARQIGLIAAGSMARFSFADPENLILPEQDYGRRLAYEFGLQARFRMGDRVFAQSGLELDVKGARVTFGETLEIPGVSDPVSGRWRVTESLYYVTFPLRVGIIAPGDRTRLFLLAGPEISYLVAARERSKFSGRGHEVAGTASTTDRYPSFDLSLGGLVGIEHPVGSRVGTVFAGYSRGLLNINDSLNRNQHHIYNDVLRFGFGIWL